MQRNSKDGEVYTHASNLTRRERKKTNDYCLKHTRIQIGL